MLPKGKLGLGLNRIQSLSPYYLPYSFHLESRARSFGLLESRSTNNHIHFVEINAFHFATNSWTSSISRSHDPVVMDTSFPQHRLRTRDAVSISSPARFLLPSSAPSIIVICTIQTHSFPTNLHHPDGA